MKTLRTAYNEQLESEQQDGFEYRAALRLAHGATDTLRQENSLLLDRLTTAQRINWILAALLIASAAAWVVGH